jgi:hypothetical protein
LLHGGVMTSVGLACAWTNRAAVWAFCTRSDKTNAAATADWKPFTLGNLGTALAWYTKEQLRRRCPDYDTLKKDNPNAAAALAAEVGQMLLVDLANPALIAELVSKHPGLDLTTLTLTQAFSLEQSRLRKLQLEQQGLKLKDTTKAQICMERGERAHSRTRSAPVARLVPAVRSHAADRSLVPMMYLKPGEFGYDPAFPNVLVPLRTGCADERIASLKVKRPDSRKDQANWVVWNGVSYDNGKVQSGWEDNDRFFKYLKDARGTTWKGDAVTRAFTIAEEGRSGLWKQHNHNNLASTIIPARLRFRLPDADLGASD